jgi:hypothetical protein
MLRVFDGYIELKIRYKWRTAEFGLECSPLHMKEFKPELKQKACCDAITSCE